MSIEEWKRRLKDELRIGHSGPAVADAVVVACLWFCEYADITLDDDDASVILERVVDPSFVIDEEEPKEPTP